MKLFLISQNVNNDYDTYSDAVVCANDENDAKSISPEDGEQFRYITDEYPQSSIKGSWCGIDDVKVEYLGEAKEELKRGIISASFHAG